MEGEDEALAGESAGPGMPEAGDAAVWASGPASSAVSPLSPPVLLALPSALLASARDLAAPLTVVHVADGDSRLGAMKMILDGGAGREMLEAEGRAGDRYTAVYFEEGQRLPQNPHMCRSMADPFTAIRKRNSMARLATNSTQALFERDGDVTKARPIWQNARGTVLLVMSRKAVEDVKGRGMMPQGVVRLLKGLRAADHVAVLEWDGRYEVVRMDVPPEEAGLYRTRGLGAP